MKSRDRVLEYVIKYMEKNQYSPSIREICEGVGLSSTNSVHMQLLRLAKDGEIEYEGVRKIKVRGYKFGKI